VLSFNQRLKRARIRAPLKRNNLGTLENEPSP
jgi:hypothetical protein